MHQKKMISAIYLRCDQIKASVGINVIQRDHIHKNDAYSLRNVQQDNCTLL